MKGKAVTGSGVFWLVAAVVATALAASGGESSALAGAAARDYRFDGKKLDYRTWGAEALSFLESSASLKDDLGNRYKAVHFGGMDQPIGRTKSASIYPGKTITDVLVFERPIAKAKTLKLTLPLANVGAKAT